MEMPNISIYMHDRTLKYVNYVADVLGTSRSEVIDDIIKYIKENVDEGKIWGTREWNDALEEFEGSVEESVESEESGESDFTCDACGADVDEEDTVCPACGIEFEEED